MEVKYDKENHRDYDRKETITKTFVEFFRDELFQHNECRLENKPAVVCQALANLVEVLMKKKLLDVEDLKEIACSWYLDNLRVE